MKTYPEEIYLYELQNVYAEVYEWKSPAILHWENTMDMGMLWVPSEDSETAFKR